MLAIGMAKLDSSQLTRQANVGIEMLVERVNLLVCASGADSIRDEDLSALWEQLKQATQEQLNGLHILGKTVDFNPFHCPCA